MGLVKIDERIKNLEKAKNIQEWINIVLFGLLFILSFYN